MPQPARQQAHTMPNMWYAGCNTYRDTAPEGTPTILHYVTLRVNAEDISTASSACQCIGYPQPDVNTVAFIDYRCDSAAQSAGK